MSDFKNQVRQLLDTPGVRYSAADSAAGMIWLEEDTVPREEFSIEAPDARVVTRRLHTLNSPLVNDTSFTFTANDETYEVIIQLDAGVVSASAATHSVVASVRTGMTVEQRLRTVLAAIRALPNVTAKKYATVQFILFDDTDRSVNVTAAGDAIASTTTASVTDSGLVWPAGYRPGDRWAKNEYLIVVQCWIKGGDDSHFNVVVVCRADLERMATDFVDISFPEDLAGDNFSVSYPYDGDSEEIEWTFHMAENGTYVRTPSGTPHPFFPEALLVGVRSTVQEGTRTVTHRYRRIGPTAEQAQQGYRVDYECSSGATAADRYPVVTLRLEVLLESYVPAAPGSACPIDGTTATGSNDELDFSDLKLRKPPTLETQGPVWGVTVLEYSRLPSWPTTVRQVADFPEGASIYQTTMFVESGYTAPAIDGDAETLTGVASSYVTDLREFPQGCGIYRIEIEHALVPATFSEWGSEGVRFPPLYPAVVNFPPQPVPYAGGRLGFAQTVPAKITYSFTRGADTDTVAALMPTDQIFESYLMLAVQDAQENQDLTPEEVAESVNPIWWSLPNILHDILLIEDPKSGAIVTTSTASTPPGSTYRTWISTKTRFVTRDILKKWRGKIYMRIKVEVVAR